MTLRCAAQGATPYSGQSTEPGARALRPAWRRRARPDVAAALLAVGSTSMRGSARPRRRVGQPLLCSRAVSSTIPYILHSPGRLDSAGLTRVGMPRPSAVAGPASACRPDTALPALYVITQRAGSCERWSSPILARRSNEPNGPTDGRRRRRRSYLEHSVRSLR
ncbi:hypothetical protein VTN02DRAFT_4216 [Thermoascus thermophilus]